MSESDVKPWSLSFSERYARELYHCSNCNYCVDAIWPQHGIDHVCVTMEHHTHAPGYSARGFIEAARAVAEQVPIDAGQLAERVFTCTTCGNCETVCPIGLHPGGIARALRAELVLQDAVPDPIERLRAEIVEQANPHGAPRSQRDAWTAGLAADAASSVLYFAGCAASVAVPDEARAAFRILERAGVTPALSQPDAHCCGAPLAELGYVAQAGSLARGVATRLGHAPDRQVITGGCECQSHLALQSELAPVSFANWLCSAHRDGAVRLALLPDRQSPVRVRMLESCQLKCHADEREAGDELRVAQLLRVLGVEVLNASYPRAHAMCCGAGGGMPRMQPEAAARMARARLGEYDASIVLTLDARCVAHLRGVAEDVRILGFAGFIDEYFAITPGGADQGISPDSPGALAKDSTGAGTRVKR